jgi:hypothetical protein
MMCTVSGTLKGVGLMGFTLCSEYCRKVKAIPLEAWTGP